MSEKQKSQAELLSEKILSDHIDQLHGLAKLLIERDRITVENGNRAHGIGALDIRSFEPFAKNPTISKVFREIGYADELGSGMRNSYKYTMMYSGAEPEAEEEAGPDESPVVPEQQDEADTEAAREEPIEADNATPAEEVEASALTIAMPLDAVNVGTLTNLISAKDTLIRKALGITDTRIQVTEDKVLFPWFYRELTTDETNAYTLFISQLCRHSKELKHASSRPVETDNEKYAFRCFLLRLGFIGPDYKDARKILLRNLSGSSAFRNGAPAKKESPAEEKPSEAQDAAMTEEAAE